MDHSKSYNLLEMGVERKKETPCAAGMETLTRTLKDVSPFHHFGKLDQIRSLNLSKEGES